MRVSRVYDERADDDGLRVLVDRLWPRGVAKDSGAFDEWLRDIAPSDELRRWYGHDEAKHDEFVRRYLAELAVEPAAGALASLRRLARAGPLTLVTATKQVELSQAAVLAAEL